MTYVILKTCTPDYTMTDGQPDTCRLMYQVIVCKFDLYFQNAFQSAHVQITGASAIGLALAERMHATHGHYSSLICLAVVLIVRTYAIYESSRKVLVTLLIIWVVSNLCLHCTLDTDRSFRLGWEEIPR